MTRDLLTLTYAPLLVGPIPMSPDEVADQFRQGRQATCEIDLALLANEGVTTELIAARFPDIDTSALLATPEVARRIEILSAHPSIQRAAADMAARRNVNEALAILRRKLADPECSASAAKDIAEISLKHAVQLGQPKNYARSVIALLGTFTIDSIVGTTEIQGKGRDARYILMELCRAMRCMNKGELDAIAGLLRRPNSTATLPGW